MISGQRLGGFEVSAVLGRGGMGEVWRATDTSLGREVALKLLPADFADDPERHARFEREARVLASLNHPHIATLYGLEHLEGQHVLVMELVEGEGLDDRLARGPVPVGEAIPIALQITEGLEAAHDAGIVHRDLKPANIRLRPDGTVKVLDFGLATSWEADGGEASLSMSPTITRHATAAGVILGTAAYMSPEQARGRPVDRRADIWAFGVVLWEMLTGARLFDGDSVSDVLADVLRKEVDLADLPPDTPATLRRVLRRCLERDPRRRLRDIGDARLELGELLAGRVDIEPRPDTASRRSPSRWWLAALVAVLAVAAGMGLSRALRSSPETTPRRFDLTAATTVADRDQLPSISPDGTKALWSTGDSLWVRDFSEFEATPLPGSAGARLPFWSPDSRSVGFVREDLLWRVSLEGGAPASIASLPPGSMTGSGGGAWGRDGRIRLAGSHLAGLYEIPDHGGEAVVSVPLDETTEADFHHVTHLPGSDALVVAVHGLGSLGYTLQLITDTDRTVLFGGPGKVVGSPAYAATGHVLFERLDSTPGIWALPFSIRRLEVEGSPFLVIPGGRLPSLADDGTLLYLRSGLAEARRLAWVDGDGNVDWIFEDSRAFAGPSLSPDGSRLASVIEESGAGAIWIHDLERGVTTRVPHTEGARGVPHWLPDGERLLFASDRAGRGWDLYLVSIDGTTEPTLVYDSDVYTWTTSVSTDGRLALFSEVTRDRSHNIVSLDLDTGATEVLAGTEAYETDAALSPDVRWLAYVTDETGQPEVYVRHLASAAGRVKVSSGGGEMPVWSRAGDRLFFRSRDRIMVVDARFEGSRIVLGPQRVFADLPGDDWSSLDDQDVFDVSPDGSRVVVSLVDPEAETAPRLGVVFGFLDELRRIARESQG